MNKINIEKDTEDEDIDDNLKIDDYLFKENPKYNKEYTDNDDDLHSRRLTVRDNNDDYLVAKDDTKNDDVLGNYKNDEDENENEINEEDEKLFPFKIVGDGKKKGETLGKYNSRYFEIDSAKGLFKRYSSSKEYPKNPKAVIDIRDFTLIKKQRLSKDYHDLEITYVESNKKGKLYVYEHDLYFCAAEDVASFLFRCTQSASPKEGFCRIQQHCFSTIA